MIRSFILSLTCLYGAAKTKQLEITQTVVKFSMLNMCMKFSILKDFKIEPLVQKLRRFCHTVQISCFPKTKISVMANQPTVIREVIRKKHLFRFGFYPKMGGGFCTLYLYLVPCPIEHLTLNDLYTCTLSPECLHCI